ncbi:MAG: LysE family transporter [Firmicutes bacterium]|nr:LysE family transporter [Bacillota bacterium]
MSSEGSLVKRYIRGLGLGMLLQLAIGPVCLLVFSTAGTEGFGPACALVLAVGLVDGLYIGLAVAGVGRLLERRTARRLFRVSGGLVLLLFGADLLLSLWGISLLPTLSLGSAAAGPSSGACCLPCPIP